MKRLLMRVGLPLGVTFLLGYLFFRHITPGDIGNALGRLPWEAAAGFIVLSLAGTLLRAVKYRVLVSRRLGLGEMFLITLVRNFAVDLLPARTASLAFYSALTRRRGLSLEEGGASFVIAIFYDVLALSLMLGGLLMFFPPPGPAGKYIFSGMGVLLLLSLLLILAPAPLFRRLCRRRIVTSRPRLAHAARTLSQYFDAHTRWPERLGLLLLSLAIRLAKYVSVFLLFCALVPVERNLAGFSLFSLGLAGTEMSALLPIQGAGGFGTWEMAFELVFRGLGSTRDDLRLTALVIHITTQAWEYSVGLLAFLGLWLAGRAKARGEESMEAGD